MSLRDRFRERDKYYGCSLLHLVGELFQHARPDMQEHNVQNMLLHIRLYLFGKSTQTISSVLMHNRHMLK